MKSTAVVTGFNSFSPMCLASIRILEVGFGDVLQVGVRRTKMAKDVLRRVDQQSSQQDADHSLGEHREIIVGYSALGRLLLVSFTENDEVVRIITARRTDTRERRNHEENK